ncbi:hypothetical protein BTA51_11240 [Hahella sp. CCB-MM4]|uniref:tetratricopeptide repeat protein n=1 Tax=Hahella sp. (strain CCB-MM4) TaxID=1926491 RepID=UPI000B9ADB3E|nr:tetratricopeptide repeat protein [Hahella sp. CCB-MM4]OZG73065.1 hypothetical protein BTA51_11240 [Hahella sp. CCB-MM4]
MNFLNLNKRRAQKLLDKGEALSESGKDEEAINTYLEAIQLDPENSACFYNIGLIYKYQGEWEKSLEFNTRAYELAPDDEAARWNLAIAATALRKWDIARKAWAENGLELDGNSGPINMNFGMTPIRLNPDESGEVVWATRIDPVRAIIESIPYKESGFRHHDIVLHDGAAVGYRKIKDRDYPVFNVLELFKASDFRTVTASVIIKSDEDLRVLRDLFDNSKHYFEDWTTGIKVLCKQCSEGIPHEHHDKTLENDWRSERTLGVAVHNDENIIQIFEGWQLITEGKLVQLEDVAIS